MTRFAEVALGVPQLGIQKEIYDLDNPGDCKAWDLNVANGCSTLVIKTLGHIDPRKGNIMNEILQEPVVTRQSELALDHFVLGLDDEGNEVKIKVDEAGELSLVQDVEDKDETIHWPSPRGDWSSILTNS